MFKSATLFTLLILFSTLIFAQQQPIIKLYDSIRNNLPREKLYVHFDKGNYTATDTIWFKAYLVDGTLNTPSKTSGVIYTEIIDEHNDVIQTLALPTISGLTWGAFALNERQFKTGTYTFRAYTNWMQNFGNTYFFQKQFKVFSLTAGATADVTTAKLTAPPANNKTNTGSIKASAIDLQFLPEGGNIITGASQKIAFKALNASGKGISVNGEILDSKANIVSTFASNTKGMGYFVLSAVANEQYTARIKNLTIANIALPSVKEISTALKLTNDYKSDSLTIQVANNLSNQPLTILGQSRGVICFVATLTANTQSKTIRVAKSIFPTGVCQVLVLDAQRRALNERNFFINHLDQAKIEILADKGSYKKRDSVKLHIKSSSFDKKPAQMSLSMAITDDSQVTKDSLNDANILSYLLLTSDLKGEIENPGAYFKNHDEQTHNDLEALMLTQGWVNYDWDLAKKPIFKAEKEFVLRGKITNLTNTPIANAKVTMVGQNKGFTLIDTVANEKGEFVFDQLPVMDSASFIIQALNTKGRKGTLGIEVEEFKRPEVEIVKKKLVVEEPLDSVANVLIATQNEALNKRYASGNLLREVTITGKRVIPGSKNLNGPGEADQTLTEEDLNKVPKLTLYDLLLKKVTGFRTGVRRGSSIRDFFINSEPVRFVIDGMELDFFYDSADASAATQMNDYNNFIRTTLDYYNAEDIKGVEVMAFFNKSMLYRSRFVRNWLDQTQYAYIEITTKSGHGPFLKKAANIYKYKPMNYGNKKVFYSPKYTATNDDKMPDFRSTIYWNPNIITDEKGETYVSFFTSDKKGTYTIWLEGADLEGNFGVKTIKLEVK